MRASASFFLVLTACLLFPCVGVGGAEPRPIPPGADGGLAAFASPHEIAASAVERLLIKDHKVLSRPASGVHFMRDQMLAVLVELQRAMLLPSQSAAGTSEAKALWEAAESAYHVREEFYDGTLTAQSVCVPVEANAWALLAADRLAAATGRPDVKARATALARTLGSILQGETTNGISSCPAGGPLPPGQWPLPIWALLLYSERSGDVAASSAALSRLDGEIQLRWDGAFKDPSGLVLAGVNAQYLLALQAAAVLQPIKYGSKRDDLADFSARHLLVPEGQGITAVNVRAGEGGQPQPAPGTFDSAVQVWMAYALYNDASGAVSADTAARLMTSVVDRSWSTAAGGLANDAAQLIAEPNLLAALFTSGPAVAQVTPESVRVALIVPSNPDFRFPPGSSPDAARYLISNEQSFRFSLDGVGPRMQSVLVPLDRFGSMRHSASASGYETAPRLQQAGAEVPVEVQDGVHPVLRFSADLESPSGFRLLDSIPLRPTSSQVQRDIHVFLTLNATEAVAVANLRLEVAVSEVSVAGIRFNDREVEAGDYDASEAAAIEHLPKAHLRLDLRGLTFESGVSNELRIQYADLRPPEIKEVWFAEDAEGRTPLSFDANRERFMGAAGRPTYVVAEVVDNVALRQVTAVVRQNLVAGEVVLNALDGDRFIGRLPAIPSGKVANVWVRAVDVHDTLAQAEAKPLVVQMPFWLAGNPTLLIFSGILALTTATIYVKMRRRRRP